MRRREESEVTSAQRGTQEGRSLFAVDTGENVPARAEAGETCMNTAPKCEWLKASAKGQCQNPAVCTVLAGDGAKSRTCEKHRAIAVSMDWTILKLEKPTT